MQLIPRLLLLLGFTTLPILVTILSWADYCYDYLVQEDSHNQVFDYIIVGAGSAGAVLANRLSKNNKVLLLEAGGSQLPFINSVPGFTAELLHLPELDWLHQTVPQKNALLLSENQVAKWPRGKMLGGSSNLNFMLYMRGHKLDFDNWANTTGDPTWKYENVEPYFKRSLNYNGKFINNGDSENLPRGELHIEHMSWTPTYKYLRDAAKESGYQEFGSNAHHHSGVGSFDVTQRNGERFSTFNAFLENLHLRRNLRISKFSYVTKIKLDHNNRATGVWYVQHGITKFAHASREVIISAGTIDTPKLLMLSGIGPAEHLKFIGIQPRVDLPVGKNLQDHFAVILLNVLINKPVSFIPERDFGILVGIDYLFRGKGPLTCPIPIQGQILMSTSSVKMKGIDSPDIQLYLYGLGMSEKLHFYLSKAFGLNATVLQEFLKESSGQDALAFTSALVRPKSVGEILLNDKNPFSPPRIDPGYLQHPEDMKALVESMQFIVKLVETTKAFQELNSKFSTAPLPSCKHLKFKSDAYFECYIRHVGTTMYHPTGTCRMGKLSDPRTVVDSSLRIKGVHGLRAADASIMPEIVSANTNAATIMIGEKAADMIRDFWSQQFLICDRFESVFKPYISKHSCYYSQIV